MNVETRKMLLQSIRGTLGRFLAILGIVALGVGFYAGIKSSQPDMLRSADEYLHRQRMYDLQLMSSLGLAKSDPAAFRQLPGIKAAEGACFADAYARVGESDEEVWHFQTLTSEVAIPDLTLGRMPENSGECLGDALAFKAEDLGRHIVLTASNSEDTLEHFTRSDFTVVGLARSPRYISTDRGSSELGSGRPAGFVLLPAAAFADSVYHELLLWLDLPGELYSEEYADALQHMRPPIETLLNRRGVLRSEQLKRENNAELVRARKELDDGWSEYRLGLQRSARELAEGEQKLLAAETQLEVGRTALAENEKQIREQWAELEENRQTLQADKARLDPLMAAQHDTLQALLSKELEVQAVQIQLDLAKNTLQAGPLPTIPETVEVPDWLNLGDSTDWASVINGVNSAIDSINSAMEQAQSQTTESDIAALEQQLNSLRENELKPLQYQYESQASAILELNIEVQTLEMTVSTTESILNESSLELAKSREELAAGEAELAAGWAEYRAGKEKADKELAEAKKKLEDAEKQLAEGEAELEAKLQPELFTLDRTANPGCVTFENDSAIIDGLAVVFPVFFVLVAALVCITTMTRMVNEERTQIGTLKAMGYSSSVIMSKYLLYAGFSALLGCVLGFFLGSTALPYLVWYAYSVIYEYSKLLFHFNPWMFTVCLLVSVAGSLFVTWLACHSALSEKPAELIRPKAPAVGKRVLLERIGPLWRRLPFLSKVSIRNAFRYPSRVFMMLLGIGGCTALMVAGFGTKDSLAGVGDFQYDEISLYDITVNLDAEKAGGQIGTLWADWAEHAALTHREEIRLMNPDGRGKDTDLILADAEEIHPLLSLHNSKKVELPWPGENGIVITSKLSDLLDLREGSTAVLRFSNGKEQAVTVSGVCEYYVGNAIFASPQGFADTSKNYALIRVKDGEDAALQAARLRSAEGVNYVSLTQTERETLEQSMASVDLMVLMLVFCSGALAFITLYNLTNINIMERIREVATVKVLGFTPHETAQYILNENLMLSLLGALCGLVLGKLLHRFVMESLTVDYMTYDIRIATLSFVLSFVITFVFALLTNLFMRGKLEKVNMAESLKSVE